MLLSLETMHLRQVASVSLLTALFLASLVGICVQMRTSCGFLGCAPGFLHAMQAASPLCASEGSTCVPAQQDHMVTLASLSFLSVDASFLLAVAFSLFLAFIFVSDFLNDQTLVQAYVRRLRKRRPLSIVPDFLLEAFRRGILHSKIYA